MSDKIMNIIEEIKTLSLIEAKELVDGICETFGVTAEAAVAAPAAAGPAAGDVKTEFDVILKGAGSSKLNVIKVVREITGLGLKEAKDFVESAPKAVKEAISEADANALADKLKEAGAEVEVK